MTIIDAASDKHRDQMEKLGLFCGLDLIQYKDLGNGEDYILRKDGKEITLNIRGNKYDGGFLSVGSLVDKLK